MLVLGLGLVAHAARRCEGQRRVRGIGDQVGRYVGDEVRRPIDEASHLAEDAAQRAHLIRGVGVEVGLGRVG